MLRSQPSAEMPESGSSTKAHTPKKCASPAHEAMDVDVDLDVGAPDTTGKGRGTNVGPLEDGDAQSGAMVNLIFL